MRLIDADELIIAFEPYHDCDWYTPWIIEKINETPTVEAVPVVHGEWLEFDIDYGGIPTVGYQCSECGQPNGFIADFCPNCGADMRKKVE